MKNRVLALGLLAPAALMLVSCSSSSMADRVQACLTMSIRENRTAWWAQGTWRIHGIGKRFGCADTHLNSDQLELGTEAFGVRQGGYTLSLDSLAAGAARPFFSLDGTVGATCIRFTTVETSGDSEIHYDFPGEFSGPSSVRGEFSGFGPGTCRTEGTFELTIALDPLPKAVPHPGIRADAGAVPPGDAGSVRPEDSGPESDARASDANGEGDGAVIDSGAADGAHDAPQTDALQTDAPQTDCNASGMDGSIDAVDANIVVRDGAPPDAGGDVCDEGKADSGDADLPPDDDGFVYEVWNSSAQVSGDVKAKASCAMVRSTTTGWSGLGIALGIAMLGWTRRRRRLGLSEGSALCPAWQSQLRAPPPGLGPRPQTIRVLKSRPTIS